LQTGPPIAAFVAEHRRDDDDGMGADMRSLLPFVVLVGVLPIVAFGVAAWLTDGAPFEPFAGADAETTGAAVREPVARADLRPANAHGAIAATAAVDPDRSRLRRLARDGDGTAALLLTILYEPYAGRRRPAP
jgi:hypothetical protein